MSLLLGLELKKIWNKRKAWFYVCVFSFVLVLSWQISIRNFHQNEPRDHSYFHYLDKVEGKLTEEKEIFLEKEANSLDKDIKCLEQLYTDYYDNKIDDQNFKEQEGHLLQRAAEENGFLQIFKQYMYARENKEKRYLLDDRAWNTLFGSVNIDYCLLLIILLIIIPVFISEYEQGMSSLNHSTSQGGKKLVEKKLFLCLGITLLLCVEFYFLRLLYFYFTTGLEHGDYPIQSIEAFATSGKALSILEGYILLSALKTLAFISYTLLLAFFAVIFKKYAPTLFCGLGVILLPQFIPTKFSLFYILAFPSGFMLAEGFLYGNQIDVDPFSGKKIILRMEIPTTYLYLTLGLYLLACLLLFHGTRYMESNILMRNRNLQWRSGRKQSQWTHILSVLVFFSLFFSLTACHRRDLDLRTMGKNKRAFYNTTDKEMCAGDYSFSFQDPGDGKSMRIMKKDINTGEETRVDFDPTLLLDSSRNQLFTDGRKLYITVPSSTKLNGTTTNHSIGKRSKPSRNFLSIYAVDLATNDACLFFEKNLDLETFVFYSTFSYTSPDSSELVFLETASSFWLNDDYIFFSTDKLWQYNRKTEQFQKLQIPLNRNNIAFDGEKIHYIDNRFRLSVYDPASETYTSNPDRIVLDFILRPEGLYFLNRKDGNRLYFQSENSETAERILDKPLVAIWQDNGVILYMEKDDQQEKELPVEVYPVNH